MYLLPGLTAIVKHDDHAMTWYDHGDSYSPWYDHGNIMSWSSRIIAWSCYGDHGHYYNVVRTLIIQPTLLISAQVVVRNFLTRNWLNKPIRNYQNNIY